MLVTVEIDETSCFSEQLVLWGEKKKTRCRLSRSVNAQQTRIPSTTDQVTSRKLVRTRSERHRKHILDYSFQHEFHSTKLIWKIWCPTQDLTRNIVCMRYISCKKNPLALIIRLVCHEWLILVFSFQESERKSEEISFMNLAPFIRND